MEENKKDKLSEIDKLLRETSSENRLKFDTVEPSRADIAVEGEDDIDAILGDIASSGASVYENAQEQIAPQNDIKATLGNAEPEVTPEADDEDDEEDDQAEPVRIIDETNTTIELSDSVDYYDNAASQKQKKQKKPKQKVKLSVGQIVLICVFGLALLWGIFFTTDHTLASFGRAPIFSREVQTYEDGSASFKGLGYKIQFSFDSNSNLTQKCVPFWEDGPNDLIDQGGSAVSFE